MASLTPGVLSKLLDNAGNTNSKVTGQHRSALLQVIEIVPSLDDDPFRTRGFFLKLSDSLHSAYVSISPQDLDLIFSDKIQLGQFLYVSRFDLGTPVPVVSGLKVVPKRRPCVGNPKDLVSSDLLQLGATLNFKNAKKNGLVKRTADSKTKSKRVSKDDKVGNKKAEGLDLELRRLSLDSARRAWDHRPTPKPTNKITSSAKPKQSFNKSSHNALSLDSDKKDSSKNVSSMKRLSFSISPLTNKNDIYSPKTMKMPSKEDLKSSTERNVPGNLVKVPLNYKTWSNQRISWGVLPPAIQDLGKEAVCHRNVALLASIRALEEASALEAVIYCLQAFSELCDSSQKVSAGTLVEQFLDVHQRMQNAVVVINSLINRSIPEEKSSTHGIGSLQNLSPDVYTSTLTSKNAASWVHAAIETDLSKFSLFRKPEKSETVKSEKYHYIILENTPKFVNCENHSPVNKSNPGNNGSFSSNSRGKQVPTPRKQLLPTTKKMNSERKEGCKGSKLKEAASLAEKLLLVSHQWFLKYLEDSLNLEFGLRREGSSEIGCLLRQLKRVNEWLDDSVRGGGVESDDKIEDLRKKLYGFLLEHVESAVLAGK
ncbi:hypothetical protein EZV62_017049 [Acer yangbiense]|uniref:DUF936 domain-containing protein n=1 Tax=Acer yangbiense TaxID=1000413 RepID=A0A5C7HHP0_9ROSI|nr:hypothetical protein EZV62_017049 [Acer yangbiense]